MKMKPMYRVLFLLLALTLLCLSACSGGGTLVVESETGEGETASAPGSRRRNSRATGS